MAASSSETTAPSVRLRVSTAPAGRSGAGPLPSGARCPATDDAPTCERASRSSRQRHRGSTPDRNGGPAPSATALQQNGERAGGADERVDGEQAIGRLRGRPGCSPRNETAMGATRSLRDPLTRVLVVLTFTTGLS